MLGRNQKVWERRLMKDFHVAPINLEEGAIEDPKDEDKLSKYE